MPQADSYDLVVVGGGPGGCAAAAVAAREGLRTLMVERAAVAGFKLGESLMPETYSTFEKMGALERIKARVELHREALGAVLLAERQGLDPVLLFVGSTR